MYLFVHITMHTSSSDALFVDITHIYIWTPTGISCYTSRSQKDEICPSPEIVVCTHTYRTPPCKENVAGHSSTEMWNEII